MVGILDDLRLEMKYAPIEDFIMYATNPRKHPEAQIDRLIAGIKEFGFVIPVLTESKDDMTLVAGHGRLIAAKRLGLTQIPYIPADHMTPAQIRAFRIFDNRIQALGEDDFELLDSEFDGLIEEGFDLDFTGFNLDERQDVHKKAARARDDRTQGQKGEDDFGTVPMNPITRPGDIWHLGPHRLICADSLEPATLQVLCGSDQVHMIATDPPYAIYGSATGIASDITDDKMVCPFFEKILNIAKMRLPWFGHAYVCCDWRSWPAIWESCKRTPSMEPKNLIVWDKGGAGLGSNYANTFELIGFFSKLPAQTAMGNRPSGQRSIHKPNVMRHNRPTGENREHNAAKPVALFRDLIENSSGPGDVVLEPFCGSGTTIIAADQTDRICLAVDIEPKWCDVTIGRFMRLRETPVTLGENGPTFQEIAQQRVGDDAPEASPAGDNSGTSEAIH